MKRIGFCAAFVATLLFAAVAFSQTSNQTGQESGAGGQGHRGGMMASPEQRLERMSQMLNLTSEQKEKIKPILENESKDIQKLREDTSLSREERFSKMREIRQNTMSQIKPILNADQQKQYEEMMQRMRPRGPRGENQPPQ